MRLTSTPVSEFQILTSSSEDLVHALRFGVEGSGCRVQGLGFRFCGLEFGVRSLGLRVEGLGFRVLGSGFRD